MQASNLNNRVYFCPGKWEFSSSICNTNSIVNLVIWIEHMIIFAMMRLDKIAMMMLSPGKYLQISSEKVTLGIVLSWILSATISLTLNSLYPSAYEPAVLLCVPVLPSGFFVVVFCFFCIVFGGVIIGFFIAIIYVKKKQAQIKCTESLMSKMGYVSYKKIEKTIFSNFFAIMLNTM